MTDVSPHDRSVAYFSMEIGFHPDVPTYAGGLGILAGDMIRSAVDLRVPMVAVTLLHRQGYFFQRLDSNGRQSEESVNWAVADQLTETGDRTEVTIEGRRVVLRAWRYDVSGDGGFLVPVLLLDTDLPENGEWDRTITDQLYGRDSHYRLCQEVVLGIGGVRLLRRLGYDALTRFHMNEGHSALLTLELLRERRAAAGRPENTPQDVDAVRRQCVFTTHTPVPAGHDQFELSLVDRVMGGCQNWGIDERLCHEKRLNMTYLGLALSHYINGVAKRHGDVSQDMFAEYKIDSITNGVHVSTWVSPPYADLYDRFVPGWRQDAFSLRYALSIAADDIWHAHQQAKDDLIEQVNRDTNAGFDPSILTLGFGRRAAAYKRGDLLFEDLPRLRAVAKRGGRFQVVFAGKAHPQDPEGKALIQRIVETGRSLAPEIPVVYLPNYDFRLARLMTAGVDVWLNTPQPPLEASGTSGMKAALNGVPSLSVLDGWWIEGCIESVTGWGIASDGRSDDRGRDARSLYDKLESTVLPLYYGDRSRFIDVMRHAIALNGSFFNTQRMLQQYVVKAYFE